MKKILLLGGSAQQVVAVNVAKKLGYYTVLCDYLSDNPGQYYADKFYLVSTTDMQSIMDIAINEKIDGIIAYASDPAAPTAAYISEKLNLPGNPFKSVKTLCNKDLFRSFLSTKGFNTPRAKGFTEKLKAETEIANNLFHFPIIIKPVDSSGSKGATVVYEGDEYSKAIDFAFEYSRSKRIVIEEFIEKKHSFLIGGDIFIYQGKVILWGLMNCHRDVNVNPLVPVGKSYPTLLNDSDYCHVQKTLQEIVDKLGIKDGPMNVELIIGKDNKVYPIDIGPRSGGNMIPDLLSMIFKVDVVEMAVKVAMGESLFFDSLKGTMFYATYNLHSNKDGIFKSINFSPLIEQYIVKKCIYKKEGDEIQRFNNASHALGIVFFKFSSKEEMYMILSDIEKFINIVLR